MQQIKISNKLNKIQIDLIKNTFNNDGLIVYPTETCYGLGADATSQTAIDKLLSFKRRREGKPLSVLFANQDIASEYLDLNSVAQSLYQRFLPGPMTIVSKVKSNKFAKGIVSELNTVGIRVSSHQVAAQLAQIYQKPITATSANPSWQKKPYSFEDFVDITSQKQQDLIDLFLDFGELPVKKTSTVVDTTFDQSVILRNGQVLDLGEPVFQSHSPLQTKDYAKNILFRFYNSLRKQGLIIAISGDLGVGKTIFSKGLGEFLLIKQIINSPSYNLINEYSFDRHQIQGMMYHLDLWRLPEDFNIVQLEILSLMKKNNLIVIEWADKKMNELVDLAKLRNCAMIHLNIKQIGNSRGFYLQTISVLEE